MSLAVFCVPVPTGTLQCCNGNCSAVMVALLNPSTHNLGIVLGVI